MYEISKVYIRSIVAITGLTAALIYSVYAGTPDTNVQLAEVAGIVACCVFDKPVMD